MDWLYPELKRIDPKDRSSALQEAKDSSFDTIELVGISVALIVALVVTRYSATGMAALGRIGAALWNFVVAIPILVVFAGPFYVRRVRRGLRKYLEKHSRQ
jgi:cation transport ATPase